ncbi:MULTISPECIES: HAMP domain-containing sensor histidine kinase [unclassified Clostridioides]|uniref:sensor histidine kinase n=2 Tax=Clostridioides TaxID=1870884 RepID=UPI001431C785|nr:HAMP domain-containing histidine kinase [Clostridioides difficile]NJK15803.1 HAMP domain-containing histidine kinase [Clostridioides difficile]
MRNSKTSTKNYYKSISIVYFIVSILTFIVIKSQTNKILYMYSDSIDIIKNIDCIILIFIIFMFLISLFFVFKIRRDIVDFSNNIVCNIDDFIAGNKNIKFNLNEDTLTAKVQNKVKHMIEIIEIKNNKYVDEKENIKTLISDISHQIKIPIANISMYNETLLQKELDRKNQVSFLENMQNQVNKLDWLGNSLIKISRLETGIISLNVTKSRISDTIASALSGVFLKLEEKNISLEIDLDDKVEVYHDKKWTGEALFNIIENAVKYTPEGGKVGIKVDKMDIFTKIIISDTGIGIDESDVNNIFKRFYRSIEVTNIDGIGVGLYLAREIINKQSGFIKVDSQKNVGTTFNIYMKN